MGTPRLSEQDIKQKIEALGYRFIGPYQAYNKPLPVECKCGCGTVLGLSYAKLLLGRGCKRVNKTNRSKAHLCTQDEAVDALVKRGFVYVSGTYTGQRSRVQLKCKCGSLFETTFADAQHRIGCNRCGRQRSASRLTIDYVRDTFSRYGCDLLSTDYQTNTQKLEFRCSCGCISSKTIGNIIKSEGGCRYCAPVRISEKHKARWVSRRKTPEQKRETARGYAKRRGKNDIEYRLRNSLRQRVRSAVKRDGGLKSEHTMTLIGCSVSQLRTHLESKWRPRMSWDNYGKGDGKWSIDHIRPCASFDLTDPEQQRACFHWSNMQPLWWKDNCIKSSCLPDGTRVTTDTR